MEDVQKPEQMPAPGSMSRSQEPIIEYAGFWIRVLASVLDTIFLLMIVIPVLLIFYGPGIIFATESPGLAYDLINYALPMIVVVIFWQYRSATPGKIMMDIYIVDEKTLQHPSFGRLIVRYLGYYLSIIPLFLGLIWVGIDKRKQGFHDKIAGTLVIRKQSGRDAAPDNEDRDLIREEQLKAESQTEVKADENPLDLSADSSAPTTKRDPWKE